MLERSPPAPTGASPAPGDGPARWRAKRSVRRDGDGAASRLVASHPKRPDRPHLDMASGPESSPWCWHCASKRRLPFQRDGEVPGDGAGDLRRLGCDALAVGVRRCMAEVDGAHLQVADHLIREVSEVIGVVRCGHWLALLRHGEEATNAPRVSTQTTGEAARPADRTHRRDEAKRCRLASARRCPVVRAGSSTT